MTRTVAITGASGMLGSHLAEHYRRAGWSVRALMRDPSWDSFRERGIERARLDLERPIPAETLANVDVLVHAAYTTRFSDMASARRVNIEGTTNLMNAARRAHVPRFVFVSSLAARADAPSFYGRSKHELEQGMSGAGHVIVRPGLILAKEGGLARRLQQAMKRTRLMPLFGGGRQIVQTVHVDDLCAAIAHAAELTSGTFNVAEPDGVTMRELLGLLADAAGVRAIPLPLPVMPMLAALRAFESAKIGLPVSSENLLGLTGMRHVDTRADLQRLGVNVRVARDSIAALA